MKQLLLANTNEVVQWGKKKEKLKGNNKTDMGSFIYYVRTCVSGGKKC